MLQLVYSNWNQNSTLKYPIANGTRGGGGGAGTKFTEYTRTNSIWHEVYTPPPHFQKNVKLVPWVLLKFCEN